MDILVDEIKNDGFIGVTNDLKKVFYNVSLMGVETEQDVGIRLMLADYTHLINTIGRFICVIRIKKDESQAMLYAFDYRGKTESEYSAITKVMFSKTPQLAVMFMNHYRDLRISFTPLSDVAELSISPAP